MAIYGQEIGVKLIEALGLPKYTTWFELRCAFEEVTTVRCEYYPEDGGGLVTALAEYELCRRSDPDPEPVSFDTWMADRKEAAHRAMQERHSKLSRMDAQLIRWQSFKP